VEGGITLARMGRNVKNGPSLLFIVITLIVVAVVGARFFGFMPGGEEEPQPPIVKTGEPEPPQGTAVDPIPKVLVSTAIRLRIISPKIAMPGEVWVILCAWVRPSSGSWPA